MVMGGNTEGRTGVVSSQRVKWFERFVYVLLGMIAFAMIYPFLNVIAVSVSDYGAYLKNPMRILPGKIDLSAFKFVFTHALILSSYRNTVIVTAAGSLLSMFLTITMAFPLSRKNLRGKALFTNLLIFTMLFNGGLIPNFYLIRSLGLLDTLWALIIPGSLSAYNIILMRSFIQSIPESLEEAAKIDGASDLYILVKIILPLSTPILATLTLFFAVARWNSFFAAIVYIRDRGKWTLQLLLREIVMAAEATVLASDPEAVRSIALQNVKYAVIIVSILPILCLYPFLQKYFVKGVMIGAVKG